MKILHCADIHLGSKIEAKFSKEKSEERKSEVRAAFGRAVEYAKNNGIQVILLSGDVFDSDRPLKKDKEFFYSIVKNNSDIDFLYLRGNHDIMESYTEFGLSNLKTFSDEWTSYTYGNVVIYGIESYEANAVSMYTSFRADKSKKNLVMLHGQISDSVGNGKIHIAKLRNKNIDYLALGHIHTFSKGKIDDRGIYVYPGCLEGRGFDEIGNKGFVVIDVQDDITYEFIKNSARVFNEINVDISDAEDVYAVCKKVRAKINCSSKDIVRINLEGETSFDCEGIDKEVEKQLEHEFYLVSVKNKSIRRIDMDSLSGDISLRGEFIRTVLSSDDFSDDEKQSIISVGLCALSGREVD